MRKTVIASLAIAVAYAAPAQALEYGTPSRADEVASLKIGKAGNFGDCTGTLIDKQWVVTARHCLEAVDNAGTQARFGQGDNTQIVDVDSWAVSPTADIALLHLARTTNGLTPANISKQLPATGDIGQFYGWSSGSHMARKSILPTADMKVTELLELAQFADEAGGSPVGGTLINAHSTTTAGIQGGDSGGPFFVNGQLVGVLTGSTDVDNLDFPSPGITVTSLVDARPWIQQVIAGQVATETTSAAPGVEQESQPYAKKTGLGAALILLFAAIAARTAYSPKRSGQSQR